MYWLTHSLASAKTGGFLEQILMKSTKSALPEAYISYFRSLLFGKFFDVIEVRIFSLDAQIIFTSDMYIICCDLRILLSFSRLE